MELRWSQYGLQVNSYEAYVELMWSLCKPHGAYMEPTGAHVNSIEPIWSIVGVHIGSIEFTWAPGGFHVGPIEVYIDSTSTPT